MERKHPDGKCEIVFEDGVTKTTYPDGIEEIRYLDGSVLNVLNGNDNRILFLANGQKEIHTKNDKVREKNLVIILCIIRFMFLFTET